MKQKSDWKRITLLRKTSFKKEIKNIGCGPDVGSEVSARIACAPQLLERRIWKASSGLPTLPTIQELSWRAMDRGAKCDHFCT